MQLNTTEELKKNEIQEANAFLRQKYLYFISSMCGMVIHFNNLNILLLIISRR